MSLDIFDAYYNEKNLKRRSILILKNVSLEEKTLLHRYATLEDLFKIFAKNWILFNCLIQPTHNLTIIALWNLKGFLFGFLLKKIVFESESSYFLKNYFFMFYIVSQSSYYTQGNSNSLNTIQISSGMVGINQINESVIALLLLSATYASNFYWFFKQHEYLIENKLNSAISLIEKRERTSSFKT